MNDTAIGDFKEVTCCLCWKPITAQYLREGGKVHFLALGARAHDKCWTIRYYEPQEPQPQQEVQAALALEESE